MAKERFARKKNPHNDSFTVDYIKSIIDYDPITGIFIWKIRTDVPPKWNGRYAGKIAGYLGGKGHWMISVNNRRYAAHRLAWLYMTKEWPVNDIDHKNTNKTDNRFNNLRQASDSQNNCNGGLKKNNTSGIKGVTSWTNGRWIAQIQIFGKHYHLGIFDTKEAAGYAYREAAMRLHGEFARFG